MVKFPWVYSLASMDIRSSIDGKISMLASRNIYNVTDSHVDINIILMFVCQQHNVNYILCYNVRLIPMLVLIYVVLMLVFKQHDVNYVHQCWVVLTYVRLIHMLVVI